MEKEYYITVNTTPIKRKFTKKEFGKFAKATNQITGVTYNQFVEITEPPRSYLHCPSIYNGIRNNDNWKSQQIFELDFDSGITPKEVLDRFKKWEITPNIIYYTLKSTEYAPRFRVVLIVDEEISDKDQAQFIRDGLLKLFPEADKQCKDAARIFYGGKKTEKVSKTEIPLFNLLNIISTVMISNDNLQTRKLKKNKYSILDKYKNTDISAFSQLSHPDRREFLEKYKKNKFDFEKAEENLKILQDFKSGIHLKYAVLFGMATNFIHVLGGINYMKKIMEKNNAASKTHYNDDDFATLKSVNYYGYLPSRIENWSPYSEDADYTDIIDAVRLSRGKLDIYEPINRVSLKEVEQAFWSNINDVLKEDDHNIHIIQAPVAIGKTEHLTQLNNVTICFPTHKLKREVCERMRVEYDFVPEFPTFLKDTFNIKIQQLFNIGLSEDVNRLLKVIAYKPEQVDAQEIDIQCAQTYLKDIKKAKHSSKTILTTHIRGIYDQHIHNTLIFDEDPISELLSIKTVNLDDLKLLGSNCINKDGINNVINYIERAEANVVKESKFFNLKIEDVKAIIDTTNIDSNVIQFFSSKCFIRDKQNPDTIQYMVQRTLPANKKIIILSATAIPELYQRMFGDRVRVYTTPEPIHKGNIKQDISKSYSRTSLKSKSTNIPELDKALNYQKVITFKKYKGQFENADKEIHLENTAGYDHLKNVNCAVVGTPHKSEIVYKLYAFAMSLPVNSLNWQLQERRVEWKGMRFNFMTYEDKDLQALQLGLIESELIQAAGRARTLRYDCTVTILSDLPLRMTTEFFNLNSES